MAKRALGALFALAAALAFVVAIASSAWWSGHPVVNGRPITAKDVHVGLLGAEGCNTGGDGSCESVDIGGTFKVASYAELAATGLATILAFLVAIAAWRIADNRKGLAKAATLMTVLAAAGAGAVLALGPAIKASQTVDVPIGWGFFVFVGAIASSLIASTITRGLEPEPLRLKPTNAPLMPPGQPDIRQMLQGQPSEPAPRDSASLFNAAPQLRPLYDPQNAGYSPAPIAPTLPQRAPTPMPRDQIERLTGKPQPAPLMPGRSTSPPSAHELDWSAPPTPAPTPMTGSGPTPPPPPRMASPPEMLSSPPPGMPSPYDQSSSRGMPSPYDQSSSRGMPSPSNASSSRGMPSPHDQSSPRGMSSPHDQSSPRGMSSPHDQSSSRGIPSPHDQSSSRGMPSSPMAPSRSKPMTAPPPAPPPAPPRTKPTTAPPIGSARTAMMDSQSPPSSSPAQPPRRPGPSSPPPLRPVVPSPDRTKSPSVPPPRAKPPTSVPPPLGAKQPAIPAPKQPAIPAPKQPRPGTIGNAGASPAPARTSSPSLKARPSEPPQRQPTLAHAVPPMPRASTENDDRLETGMRETELQTAVEIDHEAKAAAQHKTRKGTEDIRTGGNRLVGDVTDPNVSGITDPNVSGITDPNVSGESRADSYDDAGENTDVGVVAAQPVDFNATIEQNPKTPVPTLDRAASVVTETPVPTLSRAPSVVATETPMPARSQPVRSQPVPMSTAPSSLPPPKETASTTSGPTPACPQCESPMAWVDEHLRFYCKSCRMYF